MEIPAVSQQNSTSTILSFDLTPDEWLGKYTRLEVWRSQLSDEGIFKPLVAYAYGPATLPPAGTLPRADSSAGTAVPVGGLKLQLLATNHLVEFSFPSNPTHYSLLDVAQFINVNGQGLLHALTYNGTLYTYTTNVGAQSTIQCLDSVTNTAAIHLGFSLGQFSRGVEVAPFLVEGTSRYQVIDYDVKVGELTYYKYRLTAPERGIFGSFSSPFTNKQAGVTVQPSNLVRIYLDLVSMNGKPVVGRRVFVTAEFDGFLVDGKLLASNNMEVDTDATGRAEFYLVRGKEYRVSITGIDQTRIIKVPEDLTVTTMNLFDPLYGRDDHFSVQKRDEVYAPRRSTP